MTEEEQYSAKGFLEENYTVVELKETFEILYAKKGNRTWKIVIRAHKHTDRLRYMITQAVAMQLHCLMFLYSNICIVYKFIK